MSNQKTFQLCADDGARDHVFEVVTKERVYKFAAETLQELVDWVKALVPSTNLHKENDLIVHAEELILKATRERSLQLEAEYLLRTQSS